MRKTIVILTLLLIAPLGAGAAQLIHINLHWITDSHGCKVWDSLPSPNESVTWSGPCVDGFASGKGKLSWFINGRLHGTYDGELKEGHYDGRGVQIWPTGARYDGEWKSDRADGQGTYRSASGEVCSGMWANGCFQGKGCSHSVGTSVCPPR